MATHPPDLMLVYLPHLDYDLQRFGRDGAAGGGRGGATGRGARRRCSTRPAPAARRSWCCRSTASPTSPARSTSTGCCAPRGCCTSTPRPGWSTWIRGRRGRSRSPTIRSRTSTSVTRPTCPRSAKLCAALPGVAEVLDAAGKAAHGLDHERAGELVVLAEPGHLVHLLLLARRRAGARTSPGWWRSTASPATTRPSCSWTPPTRVRPRRAPGVALARKKSGMRYMMSVVGLDAGPSAVRGCHGRLPDDPADGPVLLCSDPAAPGQRRRHRRQGAAAGAVRPVTAAKTSGHRVASGGTSLSISSHRSRHWPQIRVGPADAMAPTRSRPFPQKQHRSVPASSATGSIVPIGVLAVWPGRRLPHVRGYTLVADQGRRLDADHHLGLLFVPPGKTAHDMSAIGTHPMYPCGGISHRCRTLVRS